MSGSESTDWQDFANKNDKSDDEWGTPPEVWRPLSRAVGGFDLDPASGAEPVPIADTRYTKEDDGLSQQWFGNVWVNPPYSNPGDWIEKAVEQHRQENTDIILMLVPARTNTNYWSNYATCADFVCFYDHKLKFLQSGERAPDYLPSAVALLVFGEPTDELIEVMNEDGWVVDVQEQTTTLGDYTRDGDE
jgi:phage N-6-adenine-methyltransferase